MKLDLTANLGQLPALLAVAELRSFTRAATALGVSTSAISQTIARLEAAVGTPLVVRTTRSVALTDAGERLVGDARPAISAATAALSATRERTGELTGVLRLNIPRLGYKRAIDRLVLAYMRAHPKMQVDVTIEDRIVDIVATGFDAGVRLHEMVQRDMVTVKLTGELRFVIVASPAYLAANGTPKRPRDVLDHECLAKRSLTSGNLHPWEFEHRKQPIEIQVHARLVATDVEVLRDAAVAGLGLAYVPEIDVRADLDEGRLVTVLDAYSPPVPGLYLYYPRASRTVPKLAAFIACARELVG